MTNELDVSEVRALKTREPTPEEEESLHELDLQLADSLAALSSSVAESVAAPMAESVAAPMAESVAALEPYALDISAGFQAAVDSYMARFSDDFLRALDGATDSDKPAPQFAPQDARGRFAAWFRESPLTMGERGKHTYRALAGLLHVSQPTAKRYVRGEVPLSRDAALRLWWAVGDEEYRAIVGDGHDADAAAARKSELMAELADVAGGLDLSRLEIAVKLVRSLNS